MILRAISMGLAVGTLAMPAWAAEPTSAATDLECEVIEVAAGRPEQAEQVRPSVPSDGGFLASELPHVARALGLTDAEVALVQARARADAKPYRADCWDRPWRLLQDERDPTVTFTRPHFITSDKAVFQIQRDGYSGGGAWTCVVRRDDRAWRSNCQQTLVTAR